MFNKAERKLILEKIQHYEALSTGVIHVHVRKKCQQDVLIEAQEYFLKQQLHQTTHSNAVLIFIAEKNQSFAILGDAAIPQHVQQSFWDDSRDILTDYFKKGEFLTGVLAVIDEMGNALVQAFPLSLLKTTL